MSSQYDRSDAGQNHASGSLKKGGEAWFWSDDEKRSICAQTTVSGVSVAQVARRYAMNANLIHNWLRDPRFAPEPKIAELDCHGGFLPVEI